jgi:lipopolysaccharide export system protein LptC
MSEPALRADSPRGEARSAAVLSGPSGWFGTAWTPAEIGTRHSRRVALLKRVLPVIGVALLLLIAVWPRLAPFWDRMRVAFPAIDLRDAKELQMVKPRYAGVDRTGRPFVVTAASGRQVPDRQDLMSLRDPRADVKTHGGADIVVTAATGVYQSQSQLLDLFGEVTLVHQNGTRFLTNSARVDAATSTAKGNEPVAGHGPSGDVKAQGFEILDKGDTILFTGRSDLLLKPAKPAPAKSAPAALPAPIATAAARAQAEAKPTLAVAKVKPAAAKTNTKPAVRRAVAPTKPGAPAPAKPAAKKS